MMAVLPIVLFLGCFAAWTLISIIKRDFSHMKNKAISSTVILLFLVHPSMIEYMFSAFE
jgi:hypothetical protein